MKLLLVVRTLATVAAVSCTLLSLFGATAVRGPLRKVARLAVWAGLGAQLGIGGADTVTKRAAAPRLLVCARLDGRPAAACGTTGLHTARDGRARFCACGRAGYWRLASDVLHGYAALWLIGIFATARSRPHQCDVDRVRLRFAAIKKVDLRRDAIATVAVHTRVVSARALRASQTLVMAFSGAPAVDLRLREPLPERTLLGLTRTIERVIVAADDPHAFAAALVA